MNFLNNESEAHFQKNGYVTEQLLDAEEVSKIIELFNTIKDLHPFPFTLCSPDSEFKKNVFYQLKDIFDNKLSALINDYRITGANFYYKSGNSAVNAVPPHQDWTFVDEEKHFSLNVWLPLVDVDKTNGAYHIIPGSHKLQLTYRGSNIPQACASLNLPLSEMEYLPMSKGVGIIYDHRLIHSTPPNISEQDRISIVLNLAPKNASLIHCYSPVNEFNQKVKVYEVDESFYWKYTFLFSGCEMPEGYNVIAEKEYVLPEFSQLQLNRVTS